ncbi:MAG: co-chaperone GroES, partial [Finegoldia magna]|nr:co-chaperone GroES [Finegoldia magna]
MNLKPIGDRLVLKKQEKEEEKTFSGIVLPSSAK